MATSEKGKGMNNTSYTIRVPKRWARISLAVVVTALVVAPLTAVASHTFTDVPSSNTHHNDIAWLRDAEVTRGCNPPANTQYCPNNFVTRAQMATFLRNLAENQVVDAATLQGLTADELTVTSSVSFTGISLTNHDFTGSSALSLGSVSVTAPADGYVLVQFDGRAFVDNGDRIVLAASNTVGWTSNDGATNVRNPNAPNFSHSRVYEVTAGTHTFHAVGQRFIDTAGSGIASVYGSLTAQYFPAGSID